MISSTTNIKNVSFELFEQVAAIVRDDKIQPARKATTNERCRFYGLYKRGTVGRLCAPYEDKDDTDIDTRPKSRPAILYFEARSKYDAWKEADALTKQEARDEYVKLAEYIVGSPVTDAIQKAT